MSPLNVTDNVTCTAALPLVKMQCMGIVNVFSILSVTWVPIVHVQLALSPARVASAGTRV